MREKSYEDRRPRNPASQGDTGASPDSSPISSPSREALVDMEKIRSRHTGILTDRAPQPPLSHDGHVLDLKRLERLRRLTRLMDSRWTIPGTRIPIGLDGIAGFVPVIGDTATALVSAYLLSEAARFRLPPTLVARMAANIGVDWLVGSVPVLGSLFDIAFKANKRNLNLLHQHLEDRLLKAERARGQ